MNTTRRGYYSLIQYCPDRSRLESANVGLVLFCPEINFLRAKFATGNDRLRRFFGSASFDADTVKSAKRAIAQRFAADRSGFATIEDLNQFIRTRANALAMTPARPVKVHNAHEQLRSMFQELVAEAIQDRRGNTAKKALEAALRTPELQGRLQFDQVVKVPIIGRELKAPYAYQNGALNLIKPQDFSANIVSAADTAMKLAMEGNLLWKHSPPNAKAKLIVVPAFAHDAEGRELSKRIIGLFHEYEVETIPVERVDELARRVAEEAH